MYSPKTNTVVIVQDAFAKAITAMRQFAQTMAAAWNSFARNCNCRGHHCNRRSRKAWHRGQVAKAVYYMMDHDDRNR